MPHSLPSLPIPPDVGPNRKFSVDGRPNRFEGCTILCHIAQDSSAHRALREAQQRLRDAAVAPSKLYWLPPASFHVTVLDAFNDGHAQGGTWPPGIPPDASMAELSTVLAERLRACDLGFEPPLRLVPDLDALARRRATKELIVCGLQWKPADAAELRRLRRLRDRLADQIGLRHAEHATYQLHTTLVYAIAWPDAAERQAWDQALVGAANHVAAQVPVLEVGVPEFCTFQSMCHFEPVFQLGAKD